MKSISEIIQEELSQFLSEDFTNGQLYGYHCTPCKNLESIEQSGFRVGPRSMQGEGVYAFYNLTDDSSGNAAVGYGSRHVGDEFCIVKFVIEYPQRLLILIKKIADDVLGANADIVKQIEKQFGDWNTYMNLIFRYMRPEYRTQEFSEQHKDWMREKFNLDNESGSQYLMFGNSYLGDVTKFGVIYHGEYGIQFLIKSPSIMQAIGYHNLKVVNGSREVSEYIPFTGKMDKLQNKINTDVKFEPLKEYLPSIENIEDLQSLKYNFDEKRKTVRNNREFDFYTNLIDLIDELLDPHDNSNESILNEIEEKFNDNFKKWFGNSKVVDPNGNPKLMYHGTNSDFSKFEKGRFGFHFGTYEQANDILLNRRGEYASNYTPGIINTLALTYGKGSNMMLVYLSIKNPIEIEDPGDDEPQLILNSIKQYLPEDDFYYLESLMPDKRVISLDNENKEDYARSEIITTLLKLGYDGAVYENTVEGLDNISNNDSWVAFKPEQIKSATGNNGEFTNSPDITKENVNENNYLDSTHVLNKNGENDTIQPNFNENFWKWFGNSKVVYNNGEPAVVYHGPRWTEREFNIFKGKETIGWFAEDESKARGYNSNKMYEVYLSIQKPFHLDGDMNDDITVEIFEERIGFKLNRKNIPTEHRSKQERGKLFVWQLVMKSITSFQEQLLIMGYDGIYAYEDKYATWGVIKNPNQIKSATKNNGKYTNSPDITKESLGETEDYRGHHEAPSPGDSDSPMHDVTMTYGEDMYGPQAMRLYGHQPEDAYSIRLIQMARNKPNMQVKIYRAIPKVITNIEKISDYEKRLKYILKTGKLPRDVNNFRNTSEYYEYLSDEIEQLKTLSNNKDKIKINNGDWVTINPAYAKIHGRSNIGEFRVLTKTVSAKNLYNEGDVNEWGYVNNLNEDVEQLQEIRQPVINYLKQQLPNMPDYVLKDLIYQNIKNSNNNDIKFLIGEFKNFKWELKQNFGVNLNIFDKPTQDNLNSREDGSSNPYNVPKDPERHQKQLELIQQRGLPKEPIIIIESEEEYGKYELLEGWHRIIQLLQLLPRGFKYPNVYVGSKELNETLNENNNKDNTKIKIGININDDSSPFTEYILNGEKTIETRNSPTLRPYVGQRIGLIKTGKKIKATLVGYIDIDKEIVYDDKKKFDKDYSKHLVGGDSPYFFDNIKFGYLLKNPERITAIPVNSRGIVSRKL